MQLLLHLLGDGLRIEGDPDSALWTLVEHKAFVEEVGPANYTYRVVHVMLTWQRKVKRHLQGCACHVDVAEKGKAPRTGLCMSC